MSRTHDKTVYKYTLERDYCFTMPTDFFGVSCQYHDDTGRVWLITQKDTCIIKAGYSWDGCSPKFNVGPIVIGIWDGRGKDGEKLLKYVSLEHDVLLQFLPVGISKSQIHRCFYDYMKQLKFRPEILYYAGVLAWGVLH